MRGSSQIKYTSVNTGNESSSSSAPINQANEVVVNYWQPIKGEKEAIAHVSIEIPSYFVACDLYVQPQPIEEGQIVTGLANAASKPTYVLADKKLYYLWSIVVKIEEHHVVTDDLKKISQLSAALNIPNFNAAVFRALSIHEQHLIANITGHKPFVSMTYCFGTNLRPAFSYMSHDAENYYFEYRTPQNLTQNRKVARLLQVRLYTLDIHRMLDLYAPIYSSLIKKGAWEYKYAAYWLSSLCLVPFKQSFSGPAQLEHELRTDKTSNCAKLCMAELEAGGIYHLISRWQLTQRNFWSVFGLSIIAFFVLGGIIRHTFKDLIFELEITALGAAGGVAGLILLCLGISCCRNTGAICTPKGVYNAALCAEKAEKAGRSAQSNFFKATQTSAPETVDHHAYHRISDEQASEASPFAQLFFPAC